MLADHDYITATHNGLSLHMIRTDPNNIELVTLNEQDNLYSSTRYGINGGFFDLGDNNMITLAISNGSSLCWNNQVGHGVLTWNTTSFGMEWAITGSDLSANLTATHSWGQGGIRLILGYNESSWRSNLISSTEATASFIDLRSPRRTGIVADTSTNKVYLIVSNTNCDITAFRKAISQYFGIQEGEQASSRYLGLSLDGGSSSQLKAKQNGSNVYVNSVGRNLRQIVALRNE